MKEKISKRLIISEIKSHYGFHKDVEFAHFLGIGANTLSMWYKRDTFNRELILKKCEDISPEWLDTHKGAMLKKDRTQQKHEATRTTAMEPVINYLKNHTPIPLIPIEAMAGYANGDNQVLDYECEQFVVPTFSGADFLIPVRGTSMQPTYIAGDLVGCRKLPLDTFFQWNKVYVLDTNQGPLIKRIKEGEDEFHVLLASDNDKYPAFQLHRKHIRALAIVIGVIRAE